MKPSDMKDVSTILVGDQFYKFQKLFKSLNVLPKSASESVQNQTKKKISVGRFDRFPLYTWINVRSYNVFATLLSLF